MRRMGIFVISITAFAFFIAQPSLLSQSPQGVASASLQERDDAKIARGKQSFKYTCESCHDPASDTVRDGPGLKGLFSDSGHKHADGTLQVHKPEEIQKRLERGGQKMPPMLGILSEDQIDDVMAYLKTL